MRALKYCVARSLDGFVVLWSELLDSISTLEHELAARDDDLLIDVLDEGLYERCADLLNPLLQPHVIMQELTLASQDAKVDSEVEVVAIYYLDQAILDLLSDVENARQVQNPLLVPTALTDSANHHTLVKLPEFLEDGYAGLVDEKDGHEGRQRVV